jgi:1,4-dihydroxy-2-naphthoate octaprenyltransferase
MEGKTRPSLAAVWLRELRAPFFVGTLSPAVFGAVYAHYTGVPFNWLLFALTFIGTALTNAGLNMTNDYFDHRSGDDYLTPATPVSGGSKVIQEGLLPPRQVLTAAVMCLVGAAGIVLYLNFVTGGRVLLAVGAVGMFIAWFYTAPPFKLGHRSGLGELVCVLGCGPVIALGAYFVQARQFSWPAVAASLPIGILMGLVLFLNEFHDVHADGAVGKRTMVVALGTGMSVRVLLGALVATYALTAVLVAAGVLPMLAFLVLVTLPLAGFAWLRARRFHADSARLLPANFAVIGLHFTVSLILTVVLLLS